MDYNSLWQSFLQAAQNEGFFYWSELLAVITGIVYVVLASRNNPWCWPWGIISSVLWTYAAYMIFDLYIDALLQVFYVFMGILGWYRWTRGNKGEMLPISTLRHSQHLIIILAGIGLSFVLGFLFAEYTPAAATYLDAFTTVFSIAATFMVVQRKLENWLYWIVVDMVYSYLYFSRGAYLFGLLFIVYTIIAIVAYWRWKKIGKPPPQPIGAGCIFL